MFASHVMTNLIVAAIAFSSASVAHASDIDAHLRSNLERIAQKRIFFGHQSVGVNLLDGIRQLAKSANVAVKIVDANTADSVNSAMIGHAFIPENGNPTRKLESFAQAMGHQASGVDIALMKFCYIDFGQETDVKQLFSHYQSTFESLRALHPKTTFVHVTVPLTIVSDGLTVRLKELFGRAPPEFAENLRREEYNALLRQAYQGRAPIFDLARIESTAPDGKLVTVEWKNRVVPAMAPAYSNDGGHLNEVGQFQAARELISVLASIPNRK